MSLPLRAGSRCHLGSRGKAVTQNGLAIIRRNASTSASSTSTSSSSRTRHALGTFALVTGGVLLTTYYLDSRSAIHRYVIPPLLRASTDPENAHLIAVKTLALGLGPKDLLNDSELLEAELWGMTLSNPVGLAAGFDKHAEAMDGLFGLGFSWVEVGSITPKPQPGNPQPRVFHLAEDDAVINRYGFPSVGFPLVLSRLRSFLSRNTSNPSSSSQILAVNLGKNKSSAPDSINDYLQGVRTFGPLADVLVINVSSPNTPGLRGLQSRGFLYELLTAVISERDGLPAASASGGFAAKWEKPKVLVKIAPDLSEDELVDIAEAVEKSGVDGVIVSNTTIQRPTSLLSEHAHETGGLSGPPVLPFSLAAIRTLRTLLPASIPLIGCGGISSGADALEFAKAGASSVQLYTVMSTQGAGATRRIKDELTHALQSGEEKKSWKQVSADAVAALANTHPQSWSAREAKLNAPKTEETFVAEAEELKREAEALKALLAEAGADGSDGVQEALKEKGLEETVAKMGLELPTDENQAQAQLTEAVEAVEAAAAVIAAAQSSPIVSSKAVEAAVDATEATSALPSTKDVAEDASAPTTAAIPPPPTTSDKPVVRLV
ncbi:hypothetical protein DL93DRAFT_2157229 [Clavulina sp. PMI_390]|nr:hypothetical protein DL93DRAFT_2157229 [Clavulina sp. PMI_390]